MQDLKGGSFEIKHVLFLIASMPETTTVAPGLEKGRWGKKGMKKSKSRVSGCRKEEKGGRRRMVSGSKSR